MPQLIINDTKTKYVARWITYLTLACWLALIAPAADKTDDLSKDVQEAVELFKKKDSNQFKEGQFKVSAQVSAVAAAEGASANARYQNGVAIFTVAKGGLMYEAIVGGQKFSYKPIK